MLASQEYSLQRQANVMGKTRQILLAGNRPRLKKAAQSSAGKVAIPRGTPIAKKKDAGETPVKKEEEEAAGGGCVCLHPVTEDPFYREGDEELSPSIKCRRSRCWHRAYDYAIEDGKNDEEAKLFASEQRAKAAVCYDV